jgi:hypothetical protein
MFQFIVTDLFMLSLGAILYLMVRALPRIAEEPERKGLLDRWAHSELPEKVDVAVNSFLFKFLRRVKIFVLKLDNTLSRELHKIKPVNDTAKSNIDFKEIAEQKKEEGQSE